ncbi:MAG: DNA cytosine methyltransferase [Dokdonella sp.]
MANFYEFFAGGGMARAGLGDGWKCTFANDFDQMKVETYAANWGRDHIVCEDVAKLSTADLPGRADLAWASFPCQDLSLAGSRRGLGTSGSKVATRSGTFWPFWSLITKLKEQNRSPKLIVLENVYGALTSNGGSDFSMICSTLSQAGYIHGAMLVDAARFVPQSRQRVFFIAVHPDLTIPSELFSDKPSVAWHPKAMTDAYAGLAADVKKNWRWWNPREPEIRSANFSDFIEENPSGVDWNSEQQTKKLLDMMSEVNRQKVSAAALKGKKIVGGVYKRTRIGVDGIKRQRAEVRFDDLAGCLRTPSGGSSRQTILIVDGKSVRSRLLSPREAARLMGLPDDYKLPLRYNDAYHVAGDGVCVPAVRHLAATILEPILLPLAQPAHRRDFN